MSLILEFFDVVSDMYEHHQALLALAREKKDILIQGDTEALQAMIGKEAEHVRSIGILEDRRLQIGASIAAHYNMNQENITLSWVEQQADPLQRHKIHALADDYEQVLAQIQEANELNRKLIEQSLHYVQYMVEIVSGTALSPSMNYGPGKDAAASVEANRRFSIFDQRI